jgi:hypothetical protein
VYSVRSPATSFAAAKSFPSVVNRCRAIFVTGKDFAHAALVTTQPHCKLAGDVSSRQRARPFPPLSLALFTRSFLCFGSMMQISSAL